ncbi:recombinase family protein [Streptomyces sp. NBC_01356]|uniref:recombinase family protein n=1 Tax=Streptomyces sp. NBC_01356 TaxID=2903836 RepID=UPI002E36DF71|nr:recombinase family protein [Streptomyces sp. NBC_01356]
MPNPPKASVPAALRPRNRASLYVRLSVAADDENMSLQGMIDDMRDLCAREGLEEVALYVDDGKSGGRRDRDEFQAWLNDARTGACDVLVNPVTDRLTREGLNVAATILDVVEGKDPATGRTAHRPVRLVDCNGIDSLHGDAFRFRFVIQAEVGRSERERIRDRSRIRARNLRRAGRWGGGTPPFGYQAIENPDGAGWVLDIASTEAEAIREAAEALLKTPPDPLTRVVRRMNHQGVQPRRAKQWSRLTLQKVLTGDHILGRATQNGHLLRDQDGKILTPFPAVLTLGQVTALRARLAPQGSSTPRGGGRPARPLSSLLTCHSCLADLVVHHSAARTRDGKHAVPGKPSRIMYRCPTRGQGGICEKPVAISAEPVEEYVIGLYLRTVGGSPMYRKQTVVSGVEELALIEEEIKELLQDLATQADADTFLKLQKAQTRQAELSQVDPQSTTQLVPTGQTVAEHWEGSMPDDRRTMLAEAFDELVIGPGRRGPKGFDVSRLAHRWAEHQELTDDDYDLMG